MKDKQLSDKKRVTLKDVSRHTGVSMMTVSNVINGREKFVGKKTRALVQEAIKDLNYRPNRSGRRLRNSQNLSIGFVIMNEFSDFLSDPFISTLASGLCNHLSDKGYCLEIQGVKPDSFRNANAFCNSGTDAICVILCGSEERRHAEIEFLKTMDQPVVILQEDYASNDENLAIVRQDDFTAGQIIASHVLKQKPGALLYVRPKTNWSAVEQRESGILNKIEQCGWDPDFATLTTPSEMFIDVFELVKERLREKNVDCIIAATDSLAMIVLKACRELNLRVPDDVSVAGFNGFESWQYSTPLLTTVVSPAYEMGASAGQMMLEHLQRGQFPSRNRIFPVHLRSGESTVPGQKEPGKRAGFA